MLVDLRTVMDRHVEAAEIDHPRIGGAMDRMERGLFGHASNLQGKNKGGAVSPRRPVCPFT
jgi:hypothetical protein